MKTFLLWLGAGLLTISSVLRAAEPVTPSPPVVPLVNIVAGDPFASEDGPSTGVFVVSRLGVTDQPLTVNYRVDGNATPGVDYVALSGSLTIPAGSSRATIVVTPIDDALVESKETVELNLIPPMRGQRNSATVTIIDNDTGHATSPTVSLVVIDPEAAEEGRETGAFTIARLGDTSEPLRVVYTFEDRPFDLPLPPDVIGVNPAINGIDFERVPEFVVIPAGAQTAQIVIRPIDDSISEGREGAILQLRPSSNYQLNPPNRGIVFIADNDTVSGNHPPSVELVRPKAGEKFSAPATILLRAEASDRDGSVRRVDFLAGHQLIGSAEREPFTLTWRNVKAGDYALTAKATDNRGAASLSKPVRVTVTKDEAPDLFSVKINFQTASASVPPGYLPDSGKVFGPRENGLRYGWDKDNQKNTRNRNSSRSPDQRFDTFAYLQRGEESFTWELAVPDGTYQVLLVAGDPNSSAGSFGINVEGTLALEGKPTGQRRWLEGNVTVSVNDGRLTVSNRPHAQNNKINFIEVTSRRSEQKPVEINIVSPREGASFTGPINLKIRAEIDHLTPGQVVRVEFLAGDRLLGADSAPPYRVVWSNAPPGDHVLTAKAIRDSGVAAVSKPVKIKILERVALPVVTIIATDAEAAETGADAEANIAVFTVTRTGSLDKELKVHYRIEGSASNGADYRQIPNTVVIPAGDSSARIEIVPLANGQVEPDEIVFLALNLPRDPPHEYSIGAGGSARVVIKDRPPKEVNNPPRVELTQPRPESVFTGPTNIQVRAEASDPDGHVRRVQFFAGDRSIGVDEEAPFAVVWNNVAPGDYVLTAKATDDKGTSAVSLPVRITVRPREEPKGLSVKINFQPPSSQVPAGYLPDFGRVFEMRDSGFAYGWDRNNQENARDRNNPASPDQRFDTLIYMKRESAAGFKWELAVPEGTYQVKLVAGDPIRFDSIYAILVEDHLAIHGQTSPSNRWLEATVKVKVSDGRLSLSTAPDARNNKVCFIEVQSESADNAPPTVKIASPKPEETFTAPANVLISAQASDPDGFVQTVEFFQNGRSLGRINNDPRRLSPINPFILIWSNAPAGIHTLTAKATDDRGATATSEGVSIHVLEHGILPVVTVEATDAEAAEVSGVGTVLNRGAFTFTRTGSADKPLRVVYEISGTAANGADYIRLDGDATIAAGSKTRNIFVAPVPDKAIEGKETVILTLKPDKAYQVGSPNHATITILEASLPSERRASIIITAPKKDQSFMAPTNIIIQATAIDPMGYIDRLEFFAGNHKIGESLITFIRAPFPGEPIQHSLEWRNVPPGSYRLTARGKDSRGETVVSGPVEITVKSATKPQTQATQHGLKRLANGTVKIDFPAQPATRYVIESTSDFIDWSLVTSLIAESDRVEIMDSSAPAASLRFYRIRSLETK